MAAGLPPYRLVRSRRKSVTLEIAEDGALVVRAPLRLARRAIEALLEEKAAWIAEKQALVLARRPAVHHYQSGEQFWFLGRTYPLWVQEQAAGGLVFSGEKFILGGAAGAGGEALFTRWYQQQARELIGGRAAELAAGFGLQFHSLRITSARRRWGSCARAPKTGRRTLSFTWRLVMAPPEIIDYVIIHELCHLLHANHSADFWAAVAARCPDYAARRAWLKEYGSQFSL